MPIDITYSFRRRSEEHTSELQSLAVISYAVFCLKKKNLTVRRRREGEDLEPPAAERHGLDLQGLFLRRHDPFVRRVFFFNDTATTQIYTTANTLSLHDALPI